MHYYLTFPCELYFYLIGPISLFSFFLFLQIMEPPWIAYNIMRKMDYPYEVFRRPLFI